MYETNYEQVPQRPEERGRAAVVLTVIDSDGRKYYILNPREIFDFRPYGRGWGGAGRGGLHVLWIGQHAPTRIGVFTDGLEAALEEAAGFAKDHWPGLLIDDAFLKTLHDEAKQELVEAGGDPEDEDLDGKAWEEATADMTYTESGHIGSDEWGIECDNGEGHPCEQELMDAIALAAAGEILGSDDSSLEDVADVARHLRGTPLWARGVDKSMPVWGDETPAVKSLLSDSQHGELISWDTTHKSPWNHEYLFWRPAAEHPRQRVVVVDHGDVFPEGDVPGASPAAGASEARRFGTQADKDEIKRALGRHADHPGFTWDWFLDRGWTMASSDGETTEGEHETLLSRVPRRFPVERHHGRTFIYPAGSP